ncbi:MAG: acyl-CoA thioesterase [Halobacteriales archaeon]
MAFEYELRVSLEDVDRFDVVFYPRVFVWLQRATEALFEAGGLSYPDLVQETGCEYPIVSADADYVRPITWGDSVTMDLTTTVGETSYRVAGVGRVDGERAFDVSRTQVTVDEEAGTSTTVPEVVREALASFTEAD